MLVLGLIDSKPSTAALMEGGRILAAVAEERLCRMKMAMGMPVQAIAEVMRVAGVAPREIDHVGVATQVNFFEPEPSPWSSWFEDQRGSSKHSRITQLGSALAPVAGYFPAARRAYHALKRFAFRERNAKLTQFLRERYDISAPVSFYDHHYCHATSAYFTSGFDHGLVVTLDGGGDGLSGSVYVGTNGRLRRLTSIDSFHSLGNFYSYVTELCGFKAERHEGKTTGLAAYGRPSYRETLRQFIRYVEPGKIRYGVPMYHRSALRLIAERLPIDFKRSDLAASAQVILEEVGAAFIRHWLRKTGCRRLAVAGGVFANVKFNQALHELGEVDELFIHPAMDDSGLAVGGGLAALAELSPDTASDLSQRLPDVYLGPSFGNSAVTKSVQASGFEATYDPAIHETIAGLLAQGHVVARFNGRMEYGPRALGNRSILYQTTDPSVNDWLNHRLQRTEFMPFAPATLKEYASKCYHGLQGAEDAARFMTITFNCTDCMRAQSPGVVHIDHTARPQIVDPNTAPDLYRILKTYHRLTGIPSMINTSFNMHEEPIVCTPDDAIRAFQLGKLDCLAIDGWLMRNPAAIESRRKQARLPGIMSSV